VIPLSRLFIAGHHRPLDDDTLLLEEIPWMSAPFPSSPKAKKETGFVFNG
jgi:hypothetical protein